ncbi:hypothetical protein L484_018877 [Morus notabilis]|uniref:Uncharacterized protein n=1 Tax=Morus notabilis TaxID=981085 RepID=W9QSK8_9ROSA|nr:hypothetical protein L484_018877 [Morus notabilis]
MQTTSWAAVLVVDIIQLPKCMFLGIYLADPSPTSLISTSLPEASRLRWCGPERIDVGRTEIYASGLVDFACNVLDGVLTDQSPQFGKCFVALTSYDTACSSQLQPVGGPDDLGSSVQQLLGGGDDHENNVP